MRFREFPRDFDSNTFLKREMYLQPSFHATYKKMFPAFWSTNHEVNQKNLTFIPGKLNNI